MAKPATTNPATNPTTNNKDLLSSEKYVIIFIMFIMLILTILSIVILIKDGEILIPGLGTLNTRVSSLWAKILLAIIFLGLWVGASFLMYWWVWIFSPKINAK